MMFMTAKLDVKKMAIAILYIDTKHNSSAFIKRKMEKLLEQLTFLFRELARKKQALSHETCIEFLKTEPRGVLSVIGDDGYPYGVPMNFWYCEEDGKIYF